MGVYSITIVVILIICATVCHAQIRCYVCNTQTGLYPEKCGDEFRWTSNEATRCAFTPSSCQKTRGHRDQGGRKVVEITRSCVPYQKEEGCRTGTHNGITAEICICNTDVCNHSNTVIYSTWGLALAAFVAVINL